MMMRSDRVVPWLLTGPALLVLAVFFAVPLVMLLSGSVQRLDPATFVITERLTVFNYGRFLLDEFYLGVLLRTLRVALLVLVATLAAGYPLALYLTKIGM